jgi:hypothetical protein
MRWAIVLLAGLGWVFAAAGPLEVGGAVLPGLIAGLGLGGLLLLGLSAAGGSLGRWLHQTRLEEQILSREVSFDPFISVTGWLEQAERDGDWINDWLDKDEHALPPDSRRFVWQEDFPSLEILAEVER